MSLGGGGSGAQRQDCNYVERESLYQVKAIAWCGSDVPTSGEEL